jgi:hypothetical protein
LRQSITTAADVSRDKVRPDARLKDLISTKRNRTWAAVRSACGIASLPALGWGSPGTVGDLARWTVAYATKEFKPPSEPWTPSEIRTVVRAVVTEVTGVEDFKDDHDFIQDIGVD